MTELTGTTPHRRRALVTGASSGIGRALAEQLVEHEYDVELAAAVAARQTKPGSGT